MKPGKLIHSLRKGEKIALAFLLLLAAWSGFEVGQAFYLENSDAAPISGGTYTEGAVGKVGSINPLLAQQGSVTHDLVSLVFSGLTQYDPQTGQITPDLAEFQRSANGKEYTFTLRKDAFWHDGQPVTADDVVFTYNTLIKDPAFKGAVLTYNDYSGIRVTKVDDATVQFLLESPDSFFLVKTMVGLLPEHLLRGESPELLDTAPFNFSPIGSGPYRYVSQVPFADHTEYDLEAFDRYYQGKPGIESIAYKVFPGAEELAKNLGALDGLRNVPPELEKELEKKGALKVQSHHLPQYVALFINSESAFLKNSGVRLALQLGTDKQALAESIGESRTIDTPLLEINQESWRLQYNVQSANGALFDTEWKIPNKEALQDQLAAAQPEQAAPPSPTAQVTAITSPNGGKDTRITQPAVTLGGTAPAGTEALFIDDYRLQKFVPGERQWSYTAKAELGNLKEGKNVYTVYAQDAEGKKEALDAITITYSTQQGLSGEEKDLVEKGNLQAPELPVRVRGDGTPLVLNLITSEKPEAYAQVAGTLQQQWKKIGVGLAIEVLSPADFQERVSKRDYDLLIFGQSLGYNLDAYPYWHSSQAKAEGLNLSQFKSFVADSLLEKARLESDDSKRKQTLEELQETISNEVPAVFLYSPAYRFALSQNVKNPSIEKLATATDRLAHIEQWSARVNRHFKPGTGVLTFLRWAARQL